MSDDTPYAVTEERVRPDLHGLDDEVVRSMFIIDEVKVVAIGWFYYCMASFQVFIALGICLFLEWRADLHFTFLVTLLLVTAGLFMITAYGMRHFYEWARKPSVLAAIIGMCMFPLGTVAGVYCIMMLRKSTAEELFSERYRGLVKSQNYKSMGWLAYIVGFLLSGVFWGGYFLLKSIGYEFSKGSIFFSNS